LHLRALAGVFDIISAHLSLRSWLRRLNWSVDKDYEFSAKAIGLHRRRVQQFAGRVEQLTANAARKN
jgi:hypothetical protein